VRATCRVEESEICYGNLDITSGTLERRPIVESVDRAPKGIKVRNLRDGAASLAVYGHVHE
jgi:hypothetical protein